MEEVCTTWRGVEPPTYLSQGSKLMKDQEEFCFSVGFFVKIVECFVLSAARLRQGHQRTTCQLKMVIAVFFLWRLPTHRQV